MCFLHFVEICPFLQHSSSNEGYSIVNASNLLCPPRLGILCTSNNRLSFIQNIVGIIEQKWQINAIEIEI